MRVITGILVVTMVLVGVTLQRGTAYAQEAQATVTVNMDLLPQDMRVELQSMANDVRTYLNSQSFTGIEWEGERIPIDVTIYLMSRSGNRYQARLAVVSKRLVNGRPETGSPMLRVFDQQWTFEWTFNPMLSFQIQRFDEFTSLIDFYVIMAIGLDMDTYDDLGGTVAYRRAQQIAQTASSAGAVGFETFYQPGEFTKMALITEMLDLRYERFRRLIFDYHDAIDLMASDPDGGRAALEVTIASLGHFKKTKITNRSVLLQAFFDAKHMEIAEVFRGRKDSPVWQDLRYLDPGNTQVYEQASNQ